MRLFNNWNLKKHFFSSLVLSSCIGTIGHFIIAKMLVKEWVIKETGKGSFLPTTHSSLIVTVIGSPLEIIITNIIVIFIILIILYRPIKIVINNKSKEGDIMNYYNAYEDRYKKVHSQGILWFSSVPTPELLEWIGVNNIST